MALSSLRILRSIELVLPLIYKRAYFLYGTSWNVSELNKALLSPCFSLLKPPFSDQILLCISYLLPRRAFGLSPMESFLDPYPTRPLYLQSTAMAHSANSSTPSCKMETCDSRQAVVSALMVLSIYLRYMSIRVHQGNIDSIINNPLLILTLLGIFLLMWWILSGTHGESSSKLPMRQVSISVIPPQDLTDRLLSRVDKVHTLVSSLSRYPMAIFILSAACPGRLSFISLSSCAMRHLR